MHAARIREIHSDLAVLDDSFTEFGNGDSGVKLSPKLARQTCHDHDDE